MDKVKGTASIFSLGENENYDGDQKMLMGENKNMILMTNRSTVQLRET